MQKKWVICELLMREAKSWQEKGAILQHHCMQMKTWFRGLTWLYLCFWFTVCKGHFSWENIGNLWNFDAWRPILTGKRYDTTTPLD
jgi:hypothetical protein